MGERRRQRRSLDEREFYDRNVEVRACCRLHAEDHRAQLDRVQ